MVCAILTRFRRARVGKAGERPALTRNCKREPFGAIVSQNARLCSPVYRCSLLETALKGGTNLGLAEMGLGGSHGYSSSLVTPI